MRDRLAVAFVILLLGLLTVTPLAAAEPDPRERYRKGVSLLQGGDLAGARAAFSAILAGFDTPENRANIEFDSLLAGSRYHLGEISLSEDKHMEAIGHYQQVIATFRFFRAESLYHQGLAHYYLKEYETAIATLGQVADQYPSSTLAPQALYYQGICHDLQKDKPAAMAVFRSLVERYPQHAWAKKAREKTNE